MATLAVTNPTMLDLATRTDPGGGQAAVVEILDQALPMWSRGSATEANDKFGHRTTIRTAIPTPTWRQINEPVADTKSTTAQITATMGDCETYGAVDVVLADAADSKEEFLLSENLPHIQGMGQEIESTAIYGNEGGTTTGAAKEFTGLAAHYNALSNGNGENILVSGSGSDLTSMYLIAWSPQTVSWIFPKGSAAGLQVNHKGQMSKQSSTGMYEAYVTHYKQIVGLLIRDWRCVVRIQYDSDDFVASGATGPNFAQLMSKAIRRIPVMYRKMTRLQFIANRATLDYLDIQAMQAANMAFSNIKDAQGYDISAFRGVPIEQCDALTVDAEAAVT